MIIEKKKKVFIYVKQGMPCWGSISKFLPVTESKISNMIRKYPPTRGHLWPDLFCVVSARLCFVSKWEWMWEKKIRDQRWDFSMIIHQTIIHRHIFLILTRDSGRPRYDLRFLWLNFSFPKSPTGAPPTPSPNFNPTTMMDPSHPVRQLGHWPVYANMHTVTRYDTYQYNTVAVKYHNHFAILRIYCSRYSCTYKQIII